MTVYATCTDADTVRVRSTGRFRVPNYNYPADTSAMSLAVIRLGPNGGPNVRTATLLSLVILGPIMHAGHTERAPVSTGGAVPLAAPPVPTTTTTTTDPVVFDAWSRVAVCENGGWNPPQGPAYPDSLGISAANWSAYNGGADLSPANQIRVAQAIQAAAGLGGYVPDQYGCAAW